MCAFLGVSRSGYYAWLKRTMRRLKRDQIAHEVQKVFEKSKGTYGSPRITEHLTGMGVQASRSTVSRVMATKGYIARPGRKFVHTTDSKHGHKIAENLLNRDFHADQVNTKWVSDITYIPTKQEWAYLTVIIDLADRMVVGWNLSDNLSCQHTAMAAMTIAMRRRIVNQPLLFHSDTEGFNTAVGLFVISLSAVDILHRA